MNDVPEPPPPPPPPGYGAPPAPPGYGVPPVPPGYAAPGWSPGYPPGYGAPVAPGYGVPGYGPAQGVPPPPGPARRRSSAGAVVALVLVVLVIVGGGVLAARHFAKASCPTLSPAAVAATGTKVVQDRDACFSAAIPTDWTNIDVNNPGQYASLLAGFKGDARQAVKLALLQASPGHFSVILLAVGGTSGSLDSDVADLKSGMSSSGASAGGLQQEPWSVGGLSAVKIHGPIVVPLPGGTGQTLSLDTVVYLVARNDRRWALVYISNESAATGAAFDAVVASFRAATDKAA